MIFSNHHCMCLTPKRNRHAYNFRINCSLVPCLMRIIYYTTLFASMVLMCCTCTWVFQPQLNNEVFEDEGGLPLAPRPSLTSDRREYRSLAAVPRLSRPSVESKVPSSSPAAPFWQRLPFWIFFSLSGGGAGVCVASDCYKGFACVRNLFGFNERK